MILNDFYTSWSIFVRSPSKTNAPLDINANAELPLPAPRKRLQPVAAQFPQVIDACRGVKDCQPLLRLVCKPLKRRDKLTFGKGLGFLVCIAKDHKAR